VAQENSTELMGNENLYQVMISEEAYYEAEKRGFASGHEMDDWLEVEKKVMRSLKLEDE